MKHPHHAKQKNLYARAFALCRLCTKLPQQRLNIGSANICLDRSGENQFQGALVLAFHRFMVAQNGIKYDLAIEVFQSTRGQDGWPFRWQQREAPD